MQDERDLLQLDHSCEAISWTLLNDPDVVLDYFAESPFWDKRCENSTCKQQGFPASELLKMTGTQYKIQLPPPPLGPDGMQRLWIVQRIRRVSPTVEEVEAIYHVVNGHIYQAPSLHDVLMSRLQKSQMYAAQAFADMEARVVFDASNQANDWNVDE